jgi:Zn finger protein HypA/HybF involved in hydrogenase expression
MKQQEMEIINSIIKKAKYHGRIKSILLEIGELSTLSPEKIKEYIIKKTNWDVLIEQKDASIKCSCGYEGKPIIPEKRKENTLIICPECSSLPKEIIGKSIILKHFELE